MSKRIPIIFGIILVIFSVWVLITPNKFIHQLTTRLNNINYDIQLRSFVLAHKYIPDTPVAVIDVDDKSLAAIGRWPWPRSQLAALVDAMVKQGAAVIAFDMFFSEAQQNPAQGMLEMLGKNNSISKELTTELEKSIPLLDEDAIFAKSIKSGKVNLAFTFSQAPETSNQLLPPLIKLTPEKMAELDIRIAQGYISNIPILQQAMSGGGFINVFPDSDGIVRRTPLVMGYHNGIYPSLALQAVMLFLNQPIELVTANYDQNKKLEGVRIGDRVIPLGSRGMMFIPYVGPSYSFNYYSAIDVIKGHLPKDALAGKILFVGTSATGLGDLHATAIQNPFPGVEIQATITHSILSNHFYQRPTWARGANLVLAIILGLAAAFVFPYMGPRSLGAVIVIFAPIVLMINNWFWVHTGYILFVFVPVIFVVLIAIVNMLYGYLFETRHRVKLKEMFGQYVPEKHIDEMLKSKSDFALHGEDREMSVLFADIRNFTSMSEDLPATTLVEVLNGVFTPMTEIIFRHKGTIDKYIGDLIMAFWGAPLRDKNHARHVLAAALEMQATVKAMQVKFKENNFPQIQLGIGVNSGVMSVGDMGSRYRRNYTVIGDAVNLASRVESLTKFYGVDIIVTEQTQHDQPKFLFRKLDRVRVKGKLSHIDIYELIGTQDDKTPEIVDELDQFHQALSDYYAQQWDAAIVLLEGLQKRYPDTKIYKIYLERIYQFKQCPLDSDWDGVFVHESK